MVLASVNPGANVGSSVLHSGTVGAALTAARFGRPGIAVSIDLGPRQHWSTALLALAQVLPVALPTAGPGGPAVVLNVNAPNVPPDRLRGVRAVGLADDPAVRLTAAQVGPGLVKVAYWETEPLGRPGDMTALAAGYATVTALRGVREDPSVPLPLPLPLPVPGALAPEAGG
ncbi:5'/3'-nucleotidase SurE [Kitasatospora sp. NPDC008050]|uniref:5'/3'-nucleotidase SurE n=1 Tax=Kitasatospora sp. NPDC008050 TaxID=3364021 RepID=UPI0036E3A5B8